MEAANPFRYVGPVPVEDLLDRDDEAQLLAGLAEAGHHARLAAPRRYGKTSILYRVTAALRDRGLRCVYADLYGVVSRADVALRVRDAYRALPGAWRRSVAAALRDVDLAVGGGLAGAGVQVRARAGDRALDEELLGLLDLPKRLFSRDGIRTVVIFDEFQDVLAAGDRIDALLRSRIQHHVHEASYIYAGSHEGMMRELFDNKDRPLFRQARAVELAPLETRVLADGIARRFSVGGRDPGPALDYLLALAAGHPQRAMQLAHHLFAATAAGESAAEDEWAKALHSVYLEVEPELQEAWARLRKNERRVVAAIAAGAQLLAHETLRSVDLSPASASRARDRLVDAGELRRDDRRGLYVTDPLFAAWVNAGRRRPSVSIEESA